MCFTMDNFTENSVTDSHFLHHSSNLHVAPYIDAFWVYHVFLPRIACGTQSMSIQEAMLLLKPTNHTYINKSYFTSQLLSISMVWSLSLVESVSVQTSVLLNATTLSWTPGLKCRLWNTARDRWQVLFSMGVSMWLVEVMIILERDWRLWRSITQSAMTGKWSRPCAWVEGHWVCVECISCQIPHSKCDLVLIIFLKVG